MGALSSSISLTRYKVEGDIINPVLENMANGLNQYSFKEIDNEPIETAMGWTSFQEPYQPNFFDYSFSFGNIMVFTLRIDKKSISAKVLKKQFTIEMNQKLKETDREFLAKHEKEAIKEKVINNLLLKIPATPNMYDLIFDYERKSLCFFSNSKVPNEALETLFLKSFNLNLIRLFPYTMAKFNSNLPESDAEKIDTLTPSLFME